MLLFCPSCYRRGEYDSKPVVLDDGDFTPPEDICQRLEKCLVITSEEGGTKGIPWVGASTLQGSPHHSEQSGTIR